MGILTRIKHSLLAKQGVFEISSDNGLIGIYALRRARGERGKPDSKLEALLADRAQRLKEKQAIAKLVSRANSLASENRIAGTPVASPSMQGEARRPDRHGWSQRALLHHRI